MSLTVSTPQSQIIQLLRKLRDESVTLVGQQVSLAKSEVAEKVSKMLGDALQLAIGGGVAYAGGILVLFAVADLLAALLIRHGMLQHHATWISRAIIGLVVSAAGVVMVLKAKKTMSSKNLVPDKTLESLSRDKEWAEHKVQTSTSS